MLGMYGDVCLQVAEDLQVCTEITQVPVWMEAQARKELEQALVCLKMRNAVDRGILPRHEADRGVAVTTDRIVRVTPLDLLRDNMNVLKTWSWLRHIYNFK